MKQMSGNPKKGLFSSPEKCLFAVTFHKHLKEAKYKWGRLTASLDSEKQAEVGTPRQLRFLTCLWVILLCRISLSERTELF